MSESAGKREQNKLEKRAKLRRAAFELFTTEGFAATTVAAVAARAGVGKGTVFLYASDKDDLLCMVMHDRLRTAVDTGLSTLPRGATLERSMLHVFGGLLRSYAEYPELARDFLRVLSSARGPNADAMGALGASFQHQLASLVRDAIARGEVAPDVPPGLAARNLFALYYGALTAWAQGLVPTVDAAIDPFLAESLALHHRGLATRLGQGPEGSRRRRPRG